MSWHDRLFRLIMRALPAEFRADYAGELEAHFRNERSETSTTIGLMRLWLATLVDVFKTAPAEHLDILARDLSFAWRMLLRRPALAAAVIITLAIGIGANTAIFSVVNGVLLAPLPYPDADRIVTIQENPTEGKGVRTGYYSFDALRSGQQSFDRIAAMASWSVVMRADNQDPERVNGVKVSWEYFRTLGLTPALGRDFDANDDTPAHRRVVILSDGLWRRRFNGDPAVIGKPISISGTTFTVVGVMPAALNEIVSATLMPGSEVWTPLGYTIDLPQACRSCRHIQMIGRVKTGVTIAQAQADATRIYQSLAQQFPRDYSSPIVMLTQIRSRFLGPARPVLLLLWAAVGVLLLIACANIANLLLIRASEREEELAIRRALGVSPQRLLRQLMTESVFLAMIGGLLGTFIAAWVTRALVASGPAEIPRLQEVAVSGPVLLYAIGLSLVTGVIFGMAPARMLFSRAGAPVLALTRTTSGPAAWRHRAWLVGANVALSTVLLVSAGLLVRSFVRLLDVDPGFNPHGVLSMEVELSGTNYVDPPSIAAFYDELAARVSTLPGVVAAGLTTNLPLTGAVDRWGITIEGRPPDQPGEAPEADRYGVGANYFAAMQIPLLRGRLIDASDSAKSAPVVVIGKTMAEQLWPGEDPIGRRITLAGGPNNPSRTIVGIVGDVRHNGLDEPATDQAYMPQVQAPWPQSSMALLIRVKDGINPLSLTASVREQLRAIDAQQPIIRLRTYDSIVSTLMATRRFTLVLLASFAATALLLAVIGLYGALSYVVMQRQREIGVRVALGAASRDIRRLIMTQGLHPVAFGLAAGLIIALGSSQLISRMLFGVTAIDALTYGVALGTMILSATFACLLPARRAAKVEPAAALRA